MWCFNLPRTLTPAKHGKQLTNKSNSRSARSSVGLKLRLNDGHWLYISDLSPAAHLPVFSASNEDKGYRIVGTGSGFPVQSSGEGTTLFVTSKHVVESADEIAKECGRFFAAMRMQAERTAKGASVDAQFKHLLDIVNLSVKKGMSEQERKEYQDTVDQIWNTYETFLSMRADPKRVMFQKYAEQVGVDSTIRTFIHRPGPATQPVLPATT